MRKVIQVFGSLGFAIFLIAFLVLILAVSTLSESWHGTPFVQRYIYSAFWFDLFLSLLWINIFCATLTRWPFQKKHTGFIITHIGILTLLIGSLLSRLFGVEGQISLFENQAKQNILQQGWEIRLLDEKQKLHKQPVKIRPSKGTYDIAIEGTPYVFTVLKSYENSTLRTTLSEGTSADATNHALRVNLSSERIGLNENFWLIENNPEDAHSSFKNIGPALIQMKVEKNGENETKPLLLLYSAKYEKSFEVPIDQKELREVKLANSELTLTRLNYYPNAKISRNELTNAPDEIRFNPAVQFEIRNANGHTEEHTRFLIFPDYPTLKGGLSADMFGLKVGLRVETPDELKSEFSPSLNFYFKNNEWSYDSVSSKGKSGRRPLEPKKATPTGWMDMVFKVSEVFVRAKIVRSIESAPASKTTDNYPALFLQNKATGAADWLSPEKNASFQTLPAGKIEMALSVQSKAVPFALKLVDFRKIDYPGTSNAQEFESDVVLMDVIKKTTIERTISMNKPLDYAGYRIFQSSFAQDPERGEMSVFTVAKNPGIGLIYSGSVIILIGVIMLFYIQPVWLGKKKRHV